MVEEKNNEKKETLKGLAAELEKKITEDKSKAKAPAGVPSEGKKVKVEKVEEVEKFESEEDVKISAKDVKKEVKDIKENVDGKKETLIPLEDYIKCAVHLGTKVITPHMKKYVYKRRADGLAVINTALIDERLREAIDFLGKYDTDKIYLVCKREAGWEAVKLFSEITGIRVFTKKYPSGITTNLELEDFFEAELTVICDPWIDKNALFDTARLKKPVLSLCDTNNYTTHVTKLIPCNNKSKKSIGCILYILAREYAKIKGLEFNASLEDFTGPLE
ncbi:30S ribosomal protein S2 [archaeon]|nr:30S ribosomal protein S2 [archaeon]